MLTIGTMKVKFSSYSWVQDIYKYIARWKVEKSACEQKKKKRNRGICVFTQPHWNPSIQNGKQPNSDLSLSATVVVLILNIGKFAKDGLVDPQAHIQTYKARWAITLLPIWSHTLKVETGGSLDIEKKKRIYHLHYLTVSVYSPNH